MLIDLCTVAPGDLPDEIFVELVAGKDYGPEMIEALRSHFVKGLDIKSCLKAHSVYANKFKMRLEKLKVDIAQAGRINALITSNLRREFEAKLEEFDTRLDSARILAAQLSATLGATPADASTAVHQRRGKVE